MAQNGVRVGDKDALLDDQVSDGEVSIIPRELSDRTRPPMNAWMLHCMRTIPKWKFKRLNHIILPGSHNSGTNVMRDSSPIAWLARYYSVTQNVDPYVQLTKLGVRFLDLRLTDQGTNGELWISHTFLSQPLLPVLQGIRKFLDETDKEILIVRIKKDFNRKLSIRGLEKLHGMILDLFSPILIVDQSKHMISLAKKGKRLLIASSLGILQSRPILARPLITSWGKTQADATSKLLTNLSNFQASIALPNSSVHALDCYLTPTATSVMKWIFSFRSWKAVEEEANKNLRAWMVEESKESIAKMNIVMLDRVSEELALQVIDLNVAKQ